MSTQTLPPKVLDKALKTKPAKHMRQSGQEVWAKAYNKRRFYEACARRKADPTDILARIFENSKEANQIALEKRAELAIKALNWLDKNVDDEPLRETPRVEIVIIDPSARTPETRPTITVETV